MKKIPPEKFGGIFLYAVLHPQKARSFKMKYMQLYNTFLAEYNSS
jgi:hypothetical protein